MTIYTDFGQINQKYNVIYADPPWSYNIQNVKAIHAVTKGYDTMTLEQIAALPVKDITADDAFLFMWVTWPKLKEIFEAKIFESWGFEYKTLGFSWTKTNKNNSKAWFGVGWYTKSNSEVCLLGVKGKPRTFKISNSVSSAIIDESEEILDSDIIAPHTQVHSKKPLEAIERIDRFIGNGAKKIELFARTSREGWDSFGNQIPITNPIV